MYYVLVLLYCKCRANVLYNMYYVLVLLYCMFGTVCGLTSEHFYYMKEKTYSRLMDIDIIAMGKPDLHELELNS